MPRVIAEFSERRVVRSSHRHGTILFLERKGQTDAMGVQLWSPIQRCSEQPERNGTEEDDGEVACLLRCLSGMVPKTAEDK